MPETNDVKDEVVSKEADSSSTAVQAEDAKPVEAAVKDEAVTSSSEAAPMVASNAVAHPEPVAVVMEAPAIPEVAAVKAEPASASETSPVIHPATSSSDAGKIDESQMADADGKYILNSRAGNTTSKTDRHLLRQQVRQKISVIIRNTCVFVVF